MSGTPLPVRAGVVNHRPQGATLLEAVLGNAWADPDGLAAPDFSTLSVTIARSLQGREADCVQALRLPRRHAVVCDAITREVMGRRVGEALARLGHVQMVVLDEPYADADTAAGLRRACASADVLVAVGSGTINDLCKYAAAADSKPYVVFATAPSMNGYASANAAITVHGHKQTLAAALPRGLFVDLEVLAHAPARLIRAGVGDSICRSTAQADWLLASYLRGEPYRQAPFAWLASDEPLWTDAPEALLQGDLQAMEALARTLVLSGLGMTLCGSSHPASQGEHLISHYVDMFAPHDRASSLHGEQVAVATLTMARVQEALLDGSPPRVMAGTTTRQDLERRFGLALGGSCWEAFAPKHLTQAAADALNERLQAGWDSVREAIQPVVMGAERIGNILRRIGAPSAPADIHLAPAFYATAVRNARFIRDRYTFLDLADDAGRLAALASA